MIFIRSLLYEVFFVLSILVYSILIAGLGAITPQSFSDRLARVWGYTNLKALALLCGLRYRVQGLEHLPQPGPAVVLAKHQSTWETIALSALMPLAHSWVLKQELVRLPFFGWALKRLKSIAIDRSEAHRAVKQLIREGEPILTAGRWVLVFPEGTRVAPGERSSYAVGGAMLATRTGHLVVPVAHNAGYFWRRRALRKRPGVIDLVIGPPIQTAGRKTAEVNAEAEAWIEATLAKLPDTTNS